LPPFEEYDMTNRTYRYFNDDPLYPFGYGLSYTSFEYDDLEIPAEVKAGEPVKVKVSVKNTGSRAGDEVVQLYLKDEEASTPRPKIQMEGFERIHLQPGQSKTVEFEIQPRQFSMIGTDETRVIEPGWFTVSVGGGQPGVKGAVSVSGRINLTGTLVEVD
jgi:beta-glucosidase